MGNVEVRKNEEGYELNLNTLIYSELLMSNVRFLVTNQICRVLYRIHWFSISYKWFLYDEMRKINGFSC